MKVRFRCDPALEAVLPKPFPARRGLPDWLKAMPMTAHSAMHDAEIRTVKQCPPFVDAMMAGFLIPLPCEVRYADGAFDWNWPIPAPSVPGHARAPLSFHAAAQVTGTPLADGTTNLIKFTSFWTIELPPGWSLLATHPVNRDDLPFRTLTGLVDADRFHQIGILFPARWLRPDLPCVLPAGLPIAQCIPVRRASLELEFDTLSGAAAEAYAAVGERVLSTPGVYRDEFRVRDHN
jgi:hypothetical protein